MRTGHWNTYHNLVDGHLVELKWFIEDDEIVFQIPVLSHLKVMMMLQDLVSVVRLTNFAGASDYDVASLLNTYFEDLHSNCI